MGNIWECVNGEEVNGSSDSIDVVLLLVEVVITEDVYVVALKGNLEEDVSNRIDVFSDKAYDVKIYFPPQEDVAEDNPAELIRKFNREVVLKASDAGMLP